MELAPGSIIEKINNLSLAIKNGGIAGLTSLGVILAGFGTFTAITNDSVAIEEIKIPKALEDQGYTPEIFTTRLLDEVKRYQNSNSSAKERVSFFGKGKDAPTDLQIAPGGIDLKAVQKVVQELLGVEKSKISGEIITRARGDVTVYDVKIRKAPEGRVIIDAAIEGTPEELISRLSMRMLEVFDPHIAAATYWSQADEFNAMRMIDIVLGNETPADDKYSLNLRAYIHITRKRFDLAEKDIRAIQEKIDSKFAPSFVAQSWLLRDTGKGQEAMRAAEKAVELAPEAWWSHAAKAQSAVLLNDTEAATVAFARVVEFRPGVPWPYLLAANFYLSSGQSELAIPVLAHALGRFPENPLLNLLYADYLQKNGQARRSVELYQKVAASERAALPANTGLAEAWAVLKNDQESAKYRAAVNLLVKAAEAKNEPIPAPLKARIAALPQ